MSDIEVLERCLPQINPAVLEYDEWLAVGCAIKNAGGPVELWETWSQRDSKRYRPGECQKKWNGFNGSRSPVGVGSVIKFMRDQGGEIEYDHPDKSRDRALDWNLTLPAEDYKVVRQEWLSELSLPSDSKGNGVEELIQYLSILFSADDFVGIVADAYKAQDGRWMPKKGEYTRTAGELIEKLTVHGEFGSVIGDYPAECGAWIRFNPLDGRGVADANITSFRYALVESDDISIERQYAIYKELELPIAALVHSGGKSLHAIVKIDAPDFREYQKRVDFLYEVCQKNGLAIDRKNRNPSRLSRLPGVMRNNVRQSLVETNIGKNTWAEWQDWIAAQNDDLPEVETLKDWFDKPPALADSLIEGILRQGHKMLISGPSKAGKSFLLLELSVAIAEGLAWLGWQCRQGRVLYVNLELDRASCYHRLSDVYKNLGIPPASAGNIDLWHLRGKAMGMDNLAPRLIRRALKRNYSAIIIDPIYKVITGDENAADQMAKFCNQFDRVCHELGAAVIYCHHHSKGDQGQKRAQDRASGSGVFARDPDALIDMIELNIDEARRKQILNRWGCEDLRQLLNQHCPDWENDVSQDDALILEKLAGYARAKLPGDITEPAIENYAKAAERTTGWRISGILREFPPLNPRNCFFRHPCHPMDDGDLLADCRAEGEEPPRKNRAEAIAEMQESKNTETLFIVEDLFSKQEIVEVKDVAGELGLTEKTTRERLKAAGVSYQKGNVIKPGEEK